MSKIALYIRLSVEDQMKKDESESIINQRYFLNDFLDRNDEFKSFQRKDILMTDTQEQMRKDHLFKECLKKLRMVKSMP